MIWKTHVWPLLKYIHGIYEAQETKKKQFFSIQCQWDEQVGFTSNNIYQVKCHNFHFSPVGNYLKARFAFYQRMRGILCQRNWKLFHNHTEESTHIRKCTLTLNVSLFEYSANAFVRFTFHLKFFYSDATVGIWIRRTAHMIICLLSKTFHERRKFPKVTIKHFGLHHSRTHRTVH